MNENNDGLRVRAHTHIEIEREKERRAEGDMSITRNYPIVRSELLTFRELYLCLVHVVDI